MTRVYNDPATFMEDMLAGFADVNSRYVIRVPGGVVRADALPRAKVAVVVGGGSGHYPAFAGIVGPGFADGAVVGNIFTSPSSDDAYHVAKAAETGAGVVITSGNYAGDVMHFSAAAERLNIEGISTRVVFVTDDVASAPAAEVTKRRGIAGDFVVFKAMSAAAEAGYDLDEVVRVGELANDSTRTLGVAFSGCTLPGADKPLFTVPDGMMGVGLGIHGEPGISEQALPSADELAQILVDGVTAELPGANRVGAILNGLGATKYEELFVLWGAVSRLLNERGLHVVDPEVGELVTSLDMAGCSLTLVALDDELERLWCAAADTPAFKKGSVAGHFQRRRVIEDVSTSDTPQVEASPASAACARRVFSALQLMKATILENESELGRIDAVAGDGDHGRGMVKGITAAVDAATTTIQAPVGTSSLLTSAGRAWEAKAGGTSGALWGNALVAFGARIGDSPEIISHSDVAAALDDAYQTIVKLGKAGPGDKTMLDALAPFISNLRLSLDSGAALPAAWQHAANAATQAAQATAALRPKVGRARPLADRSIGTPDAGAVSLALCLSAAIPALVTQ